ncbi:hypothetical protein PAXINDRAFT_18396 [Paxillus involutus ATCC 200175]|uniref:mitogen-activated protein kinase kinase kinase n=1 Tax=Paxillus involutus ATCC 200175 TaxID=664439 RepID=A0A0C9TL11_PAXIN|nr:hypothetical protein PAXINDRAFT_18396 [Paxillus involutus ATCC 200175]
MEKREPTLDLTGNIRRLGEHPCAGGSYGDIYKGLYDRTSGTIEVAVKALRFSLMLNQGGQYSSSELPDSFRRELGIWRRLDHPNIVPFLGTTSGFGPYISMVAMWMPNGTLGGVLETYGDGLSITNRFGLLQDIAAGLEYLHSRSVIHGDLSPNNVLIDETNHARLVDFGFSSIIGGSPQGLTYLEWSTRRPGTIRWAAPEQFQLADGRVLCCLRMSAGLNIDSLGLIRKTTVGESPGRPSSRAIEDGHWAFIQECWQPAATRLSAKEVVGGTKRMNNILMIIAKSVGGFAFIAGLRMLITRWPLPALSSKCVTSGCQLLYPCTNHDTAVTRSQRVVSRSQPVRDLGFLSTTPMLTTTWPYPVLRNPYPVLSFPCITAQAPEQESYLYKARGLYSYNASPDDPNEISFTRGEILDIVDKQGKWWQAKKFDGTIGIAPSNYLQIL